MPVAMSWWRHGTDVSVVVIVFMWLVLQPVGDATFFLLLPEIVCGLKSFLVHGHSSLVR